LRFNLIFSDGRALGRIVWRKDLVLTGVDALDYVYLVAPDGGILKKCRDDFVTTEVA